MMMGERLVIKVVRIKKGHNGTRPAGGGFVSGVIPADGFILTTNEPNGIPIYVRDEDIERARAKKGRYDRPVPIEAESWGDGEVNGNAK